MIGLHYDSKTEDQDAQRAGYKDADEAEEAQWAGFRNSAELHFVDDAIRKAGLGTSLLDYAKKNGHKRLMDFMQTADHGHPISGSDYAKTWGYVPADPEALTDSERKDVLHMAQYYNPPDSDAWKPGSALDMQAKADGFRDINEAHWAAAKGFHNSTEMHDVEAAAAQAASYANDPSLTTDKFLAMAQKNGYADGHAVAQTLAQASTLAAAAPPKPSANSQSGVRNAGASDVAAHHPARDYTLTSADNFGANNGGAALAAIQKRLTTTSGQDSKPYLATGATAGATINAWENYLRDQGYYNGPMNDEAMGSRLRAATRDWAKDHGATLTSDGVFDGTSVLAVLNSTDAPAAGLQQQPQLAGSQPDPAAAPPATTVASVPPSQNSNGADVPVDAASGGGVYRTIGIGTNTETPDTQDAQANPPPPPPDISPPGVIASGLQPQPQPQSPPQPAAAAVPASTPAQNKPPHRSLLKKIFWGNAGPELAPGEYKYAAFGVRQPHAQNHRQQMPPPQPQSHPALQYTAWNDFSRDEKARYQQYYDQGYELRSEGNYDKMTAAVNDIKAQNPNDPVALHAFQLGSGAAIKANPKMEKTVEQQTRDWHAQNNGGDVPGDAGQLTWKRFKQSFGVAPEN
jgi:hypothetical protein